MSKPIRKSGNKELWDDKESGCYRVTCDNGYCFEQPGPTGQNGLHELITDYAWTDGGKAYHLKGARRDFNANEAEPCEAPNCEWCHPEHSQ